MKKFCESLREHTMEIIIFFYKRNEFINKQTNCRNHVKMQKFEDRYAKDKKYLKATDHCHYTRKHRGAVHSIHNLKERVSN